MFMKLFFVVVLAASAIADEVDFDACSETVPSPTKVRVEGCAGDECTLYKGNSVTFEVDFNSPADASDLSIAVDARLFGTWQPWGAVPKQVCGTQVDCPLKKGSTYTYKFSTSILDEYPSIKTRIRYNLKSTDGDSIFCFTYPLTVA